MKVKRIVVTGTRHAGPECHEFLADVLNDYPDCRVLVGCARGVDEFVREYITSFEDRKDLLQVFQADWSRGRIAGPLRNAEMLDAAHPTDTRVLAFPHRQKSRGTWDCIQQAATRGYEIRIYPLA